MFFSNIEIVLQDRNYNFVKNEAQYQGQDVPTSENYTFLELWTEFELQPWNSEDIHLAKNIVHFHDLKPFHFYEFSHQAYEHFEILLA